MAFFSKKHKPSEEMGHKGNDLYSILKKMVANKTKKHLSIKVMKTSSTSERNRFPVKKQICVDSGDDF